MGEVVVFWRLGNNKLENPGTWFYLEIIDEFDGEDLYHLGI